MCWCNGSHLNEFESASDLEIKAQIYNLAASINGSTFRFVTNNAKAQLDRTTAREQLRVARRLNKCHLINTEFANNHLKQHTASHLDKFVRRYQLVDENQNPIEPCDHEQQRKMSYYQDYDGMWVSRNKSECAQLLFLRSERMDARRGRNKDVRRAGGVTSTGRFQATYLSNPLKQLFVKRKKMLPPKRLSRFLSSKLKCQPSNERVLPKNEQMHSLPWRSILLLA